MTLRKKYISYLRVSTEKQGRSGLGLEAQRAIIEHYTQADGAEVVREFCEIESGKNIEGRPILQEAVRFCLAEDCILVVAKLDRLSRDVEHVFKLLRELKGQLKCCDLPTTDSLTLSIFAGLAQRERELISIRTRQALQAKKAQGMKLGKIENLSQEGRIKGGERKKQIAQENPLNSQVISVIENYKKQGWKYQAIAEQLNKSKFKTVKGKTFTKSIVRYLWVRQTG